MSPRAFFVTEKVEPQMIVIPRRNRSARGKSFPVVLSLSCCIMLGASSCESGRARVLPRDTFVSVYAGRLFVTELYRFDPGRRARAVDSVYRVHGVDSATVASTLDWYARNPEDLAPLFDSTIAALERRASVLVPRDTARRADP
jgi:hypothetical protein